MPLILLRCGRKDTFCKYDLLCWCISTGSFASIEGLQAPNSISDITGAPGLATIVVPQRFEEDLVKACMR